LIVDGKIIGPSAWAAAPGPRTTPSPRRAWHPSS